MHGQTKPSFPSPAKSPVCMTQMESSQWRRHNIYSLHRMMLSSHFPRSISKPAQCSWCPASIQPNAHSTIFLSSLGAGTSDDKAGQQTQLSHYSAHQHPGEVSARAYCMSRKASQVQNRRQTSKKHKVADAYACRAATACKKLKVTNHGMVTLFLMFFTSYIYLNLGNM